MLYPAELRDHFLFRTTRNLTCDRPDFDVGMLPETSALSYAIDFRAANILIQNGTETIILQRRAS
jgi:hypothetical protein